MIGLPVSKEFANSILQIVMVTNTVTAATLHVTVIWLHIVTLSQYHNVM